MIYNGVRIEKLHTLATFFTFTIFISRLIHVESKAGNIPVIVFTTTLFDATV